MNEIEKIIGLLRQAKKVADAGMTDMTASEEVRQYHRHQSWALHNAIGGLGYVSMRAGVGSHSAVPAGLTHLMQGVGSGRLGISELRGLHEYAPRFVTMMREGLRLTARQLDEMAVAGTLTVEQIARSMQ